MKDLITYQRAAKALGITVQALRNKVSAMGIELAKQGNRAYFTPEQLEGLRSPEGEAVYILSAETLKNFDEDTQQEIKNLSI